MNIIRNEYNDISVNLDKVEFIEKAGYGMTFGFSKNEVLWIFPDEKTRDETWNNIVKKFREV